MNKKITYLLLFFLATGNLLLGQEFLTTTNYSVQVKKQQKKTAKLSLELPFFDDFAIDYSNPDPELWEGNSVYINNTYSNNPVNIGVATLDAINNNGNMHSLATNQQFNADTLSSLPINLGSTVEDEVFLSFFYQPQGVADMPEENDRLFVEFYIVEEDLWEEVWETPGTSIHEFTQVMIPVDSAKYRKNGFRFRFRNIASTPDDPDLIAQFSNCDHWNIDYVYLNKGRTENDLDFEDVGLVSLQTNIFKNYTIIPWKHLTESTEIPAMINPLYFNTKYRNLNNKKYPNVTRKFKISNIDNPAYSITLPAGADTVDANELVEFQHKFLFDYEIDDQKDSARYEFMAFLKTDTEDDPLKKKRRYNDTIRSVQKFYNYYAYDDGSAELGYGIKGEGSKNAFVALKYDSYISDKIRGIQVFFNKTQEYHEELEYEFMRKFFIVKIWKNNNGKPGEEIYSQAGSHSDFTNELNGFITIPIDTTLEIKNDFFIGWQQTTDKFLNVGFDVNTSFNDTIQTGDSYIVKNKNLFYNIDGSWHQSSFRGSLMFRPIFQEESLTGIEEKEINIKLPLTLYPNPVKDILRIKYDGMDILDENELEISIYSVSGQEVYSGKFEEEINIDQLQNGFYLLRVSNSRSINGVYKFIIQH